MKTEQHNEETHRTECLPSEVLEIDFQQIRGRNCPAREQHATGERTRGSQEDTSADLIGRPTLRGDLGSLTDSQGLVISSITDGAMYVNPCKMRPKRSMTEQIKTHNITKWES